MFAVLDDQIRIDEHKATSKRQRVVRWTLIALLSVVVFSALYYGLSLV